MKVATLDPPMQLQSLTQSLVRLKKDVSRMAVEDLKLERLRQLHRLAESARNEIALLMTKCAQDECPESADEETNRCEDGSMDQPKIVAVVCGHLGNLVVDEAGDVSFVDVVFPELIQHRQELFRSLTSQLRAGAPLRAGNGELVEVSAPILPSQVAALSSVMSRRSNGEFWLQALPSATASSGNTGNTSQR